MRAPLTLIVLVAVGLAACGDDASTDRTSAPADTTVAASSQATSSTTTTPTTATDTAETTPAQTPTTHQHFRSPTGNIGCAAITEPVAEVRCDIREHSFAVPAKPPDCEVDYGPGLVIEAGSSAHFVCAGDTALNSGPVLEYGQVNKTGSISCTSREGGMTCVDTETGRGFLLSRDSYKLL